MNHSPAAPEPSESPAEHGRVSLAPGDGQPGARDVWQATLDALGVEMGLAILNADGHVIASNMAWRTRCPCAHAFGLSECGATTDEQRLREGVRAVLSGQSPLFNTEVESVGEDGRACFSIVRASRIEFGADLDFGIDAAAPSTWSPSETASPMANSVVGTSNMETAMEGDPVRTAALDEARLMRRTVERTIEQAVGLALVACEDVSERRREQSEREDAGRRESMQHALREQEHQARRRADFLARTAEVLVSSLDLDTTLAQAAHGCVPFLADWCLVDLVEGDSFRRVALAFSDEQDGAPLPASELERRHALARSYRRLFSLHADVEVGPAHVIRTGESELHAHVEGNLLGRAAFDEGHLRLLRELKIRSAMVVPLSTRGRTLGALSFVRSWREGESGEPLPDEAQTPFYTSDDLKLAEDVARVAALAVDNARLYGQAEAANRAKDDFLAVLSHELRTPLTPILGWVYLLREEKPEEGIYHRALDIIEANARAQSRLIEDLIDVSRVVTGKLALEKRSVPLRKMLLEVVESARPNVQAKALALSLDVPPAAGNVLGDEGRLKQALSNLLNNAIKFTERGGSIGVRLEELDGQARIVVADTGRGIEPEFLPRLFERFEQAEPSTARGSGGLGLGLTIVRHIVRLHGGEVWAFSEGLGHGSSFTIELPLLPPPREAVPREGEKPPLLSIEGAKILVVDDEPDARDLLETMLTRAGATVKTAEDAARAWQMFEEWRPDILVSDLGMPGEDGYALIRRVRSRGVREGGAIPALAVTAWARPEDRTRSVEAGFNLHVDKPIDPAKLALALMELLSLARR